MNNDKKFHWFPFYYQAWMTDMNVQMLSHSEKGLYIDMLCSCFNEDGLPTDHKMLKRLFKCDDDDLQMVVTLFHERDGKLHNKKLDEIKAEQAEVSKKKSVAGKASAQARKAKRLAEATPVEQPLKSVATEAQQNPTSREEESREEKSRVDKNREDDGKVPPSLEDVILYFTENGYTKESATKMWEYYEESRKPRGRVWKDGRGNTVKNWKQKARSIWFKDDNRQDKKEYDFKNFENVEYP
jgi:uncharacterized protein YdaU (DUF1376 family)